MSNKIDKAVFVGNEKDFVSYEIKSVEDCTSTVGERFLTHGFLIDTLRKVMGRTLTLIDASITDKQQNKATKDIIRNVFSDEMEFAADWAFDQIKIQAVAEENYKDVDLEDVETVTIEEALGVK